MLTYSFDSKNKPQFGDSGISIDHHAATRALPGAKREPKGARHRATVGAIVVNHIAESPRRIWLSHAFCRQGSEGRM
jgi:hypothetical protein